MKQLIKGLLFTLAFFHVMVKAEAEEAEFEEISVFVRIQGIGGFDMNAVYEYGSGHIFLPVVELFQTLRIKTEVSPDERRITGFLESEDKTYVIDYDARNVVYDKTTYPLDEGDMIKTSPGLFLRSNLYGQIFGLYATFHFRSLSVEIKTDLQLPAIREMRLEQLRRNIEQLRGETKVDTTLLRNYHMFRFGMLDWSVSSTQSTRHADDTRFILDFGAELLGGETNLLLNYSSRYGFTERNQHLSWRWVNNSTDLVKQVQIGRVRPGMIASVYDPVLGISVTNAPATYRRSFGEYTLTDYSEPGWSVELYINNVLVDYQTADASGFFSFQVPMVYGSSQITLKYYGPYGEERIKEQFLNVPFSFLPMGELEYRVTGGIVRGDSLSRFGRIEAGYGVNRFLTLGGGFEYLSSIAGRPEIPFVTASIAPFQRLIISGEYAGGVRSKAILNYRLPKSLILELDYAWYVPGQKAIRFNYLEERKASLSAPVRLPFLKGYSRWSYRQNVYENITHNTADMTFSTWIGQLNVNLSGYANWIDNRAPLIYSNISGGIRFGRNFTFRPRGQIDLSARSLVFLNAELEKRFSRSGYVSLSAEKNFRSDFSSINFNVRWDMPFGQASLSGRYVADEFMASQGAGGSIALGSGKSRIIADNQPMAGRAGISLVPFLDLNHNNLRDKDEPLVAGLSIRVNGGRILKNIQDTLVRIVNIEPYTSYTVELDDHSLEEIAWQLKNKSLKVYTDPNQFKRIEIPIFPMGEANGAVYIKETSGTRGQGRLLVNFFREEGSFITRTISESDGSFTLLGLPPGKLYAEPDTVQLEKLKLTADPPRIHFDVKPMKSGDIINDLTFSLHKQREDTLAHEPVMSLTEKELGEDMNANPPAAIVYRVQLLALSKPLKDKNYFKTLLEKIPGLSVEEIKGEDGLYRYSSTGLYDEKEARKLLQTIRDTGWEDCFLSRYELPEP